MTGHSIVEGAELLGEEKRMLLSLIVLALVMIVIALAQWLVDHFGAARVLRWFVLLVLCLAAYGIAALHAANLI